MSTEMPDPTPADAKLEFWRRTPPALFPSMMGLLGLGLAWRAAAEMGPLSVTPWISYVILLIACVLQLFVLSCYLSKASYRLGVIVEDMATVPGRGGISALTVSIFLFAAALIPLSPNVASIALFIALPLHILTTAIAIWIMFRTAGGLIVSPAWHLSFVGIIVAGLAAIPLGYTGLAQFILTFTVIASIVIYGVSLLQISKSDTPPPLRPMLAIHLAPVSLFAIVSNLLGSTNLSLVFGALAVGVAGVLLSKTRYLVAAGFSPLWGAFTFPIAAFSTALFTMSAQVGLFAWLAFVPLVFASILTPIIVVRLMIMWASGVLATKTGSATA